MTKIPNIKVPRARMPEQVATKKIGKLFQRNNLLNKKVIECPACEGSGKKPEDNTKICEDCSGKGQVQVTIQK